MFPCLINYVDNLA